MPIAFSIGRITLLYACFELPTIMKVAQPNARITTCEGFNIIIIKFFHSK
jgi:hypothetical protein